MSEPNGPALAGKLAVVTGGSRGIGLAIVEAFLQAGAEVVSCGRGDRPSCLPARSFWVRADLARPADIDALVESACTHGTPDILVNNAGLQIEKSIVQSSDDDWDQIMSLNMRAVFLTSRAFIPLMAANGGGNIINIGSISARTADPGLALYNASKSFVHGLTRSIAVDHGDEGIRCNAIAPGWIMTEMADAAFAVANDPQAAERDAVYRHAVKRLGKPDDVASMAVWLASGAAGFVSGQVFTVDGGLTAASPLRPELY